MPGGDGTGPMREGSMTGGGFGPCGGGSRGSAGGGYGARGGSFGRGAGWRNRRWAPAWSGQAQDTSAAEPGLLQRLTAELKHLQERIASLENTK